MIGSVHIPDSHHLFIFIQKTFAEYFYVPDTVLSSVDMVIKESCSEPDCRILGWACGRTWGRQFCPCPWGSQPNGEPRHPYTGTARFLLCLQSSGNVWVTHEEMETLATSTKTVSQALGPGSEVRTDDLHEDEGKVIGSQRRLQLIEPPEVVLKDWDP